MKCVSIYSTDPYQRAKAKVVELKRFFTHLVIYLIFVPVFIFLATTSTRFPWAIIPIVGWGLGVLGHATEVFGWNPFFSREWKERKIRELMEQDKHSSNNLN